MNEEEEEKNADDEPVQKYKPKKKSRQQLKDEKKAAKAQARNGKDYEHFLQDIEDDPELRANINLYKDEDIIAQLAALTLDETPAQSKLKKDLQSGKAVVEGDIRKVKEVKRKTEKGKEA
jgi:hypothetical protein